MEPTKTAQILNLPAKTTPLLKVEHEYQRPWVYPKQRAAIFHNKRYGLIEASTKSGKTTGCLIWLTEQALLGNAGENYWWVAPVYPQAKIAFRRLKRSLTREAYDANESELTITLINEAVVSFKSAEKPDNLYGDDVHAAVFDEASRGRQEAWHAVRSTLTATNGLFRGIGNVRGRVNWFYHLCRRAESGEADMHYAKLIAADAVAAGIITQAEVEDARRTLPAEVFKELYLAEPSDDGGNPFGMKAISECTKPLSTSKPVCYGIDLAKSVDFTVIIGLDGKGQTCYYERFQKPWPDTKRRISQVVGQNTPTLIDSTGVGDVVVEDLQREHSNIEGFKFTQSSKQQLMEGLTIAIQNHEICFPDGPIAIELNQFEYQYTRTGVSYSAPEGVHDDCVCALALANRRRTIITPNQGIIDYYLNSKP